MLGELTVLLQRAWKEDLVPQDWCLADGSQIPKEKNSIGIGNFRPIPLLNVEGKIFFGVIASRMTNFLMDNEFIDTPGIPGFPGFLEHAKMIWNSIRMAKQDQRELHVVWLHLANAYGSVPHDLIYRYFDFFYIPEKIKGLLRKYFDSAFTRFTTQRYTTNWQALEVGVMMG